MTFQKVSSPLGTLAKELTGFLQRGIPIFIVPFVFPQSVSDIYSFFLRIRFSCKPISTLYMPAFYR